MSFLTTLEGLVVETEEDVEKVVVAIKNGGVVALAHIKAVIAWGVSEIPNAIADLKAGSAFVASIPGATAIPDVQAALAVTAVAESALAKLAADNLTSATTPQVALDVYTVVQQARAALPAAKAAAVSPST